ncbi:MAG: ATP-binding protein [Desulfurococcales archaeon]|nr:ATP-binding protein [Desulfurococcales archaeon]
MIEKFVDRNDELRVLMESWSSRPSLMIIYGRRRVGKTRLLKEFMRGVRGAYFLSRLTNHADNLRGLAGAVGRVVEGFGAGKEYVSIDALLKDAWSSGVELVVIDEFTYWVRVAPRVMSELQLFVDEYLPKTRMLLVLCGSLIGVMERDVLGGGAPLYGRRSFSIKVEPLKPWVLKEFLPNYSSMERMTTYAVFGGVPYYLRLIDDSVDLVENVGKLIVSKGGPLRDEAEFMLREEFRNPSVYGRILRAMASGATTLGKIADAAGLPHTHAIAYLDNLRRVGIVDRRAPLWGRRGTYVIRDYFMNFNYSVIEKVRSLMELEMYDEALNEIRKALPTYLGRAFEEVVRDLLPILKRKGYVIPFTKVGKVVRKGVEIDLALLNERSGIAQLIEVKWSKVGPKDASRHLRNLERKAEYLGFTERFNEVKYLIIAREGEGGEEVVTLADLDL